MTKIIWMTDPHFQNRGTIGGLDPRLRLEAAIDHANRHHGDADFAILSGDLVGDDIEGDYRELARYLARSALPIHPMMGNNDHRQAFRDQLVLPEGAMEAFNQYVIETPQGHVICLDTHKVGSHAGELCEARLAWLQEVLRQGEDRPSYIFMHHPPLALGLPKQDEIMLEDSEAFLDLVAAHPNVRHLFMGHVHRPTSGHIRGIPFATLGALSFQAPAPRPAWDWESFAPAAEAPHYGVIEISAQSVVLQFTQFCSADFAVARG